MNLTQFFRLCLGTWRSQLSSHHLLRDRHETRRGTMTIEAIAADDREVVALCDRHGIDSGGAFHPLAIVADNEGLPVERELWVPLPDPSYPNRGSLLRLSDGDKVPRTCAYALGEDATFILTADYERAAAEERIWFATPNLRLRACVVRTHDSGSATATTFSSDVRDVSASLAARDRRSAVALQL